MNERNTPDVEEHDIARLLQAAGPREQLPEALKESWEQVFRAELEQVQSARRRSRRRFFAAIAAIAAGLVAFTVGGLLLQQKDALDVPLMRVEAVAGGVKADASQVRPGDLLAVGATLDTGNDGRLAIAWAGYDLRFDAKTRAVVDTEGVHLDRGRLYVSDEDNRVRQHRLTVTTAVAKIRDIGTQFMVMTGPGGTEAMVRRGAIVIDTGSDEIQARAQIGQASRVQVDDSLQVTTARAAANGRNWEWIYAVAPTHAIDGESAYEFLRWSTGESGLQLQFNDASAEYYARATILHGSLRSPQDPDRAVEIVLATTDLVAERQGTVLRIILAP